MKKCVSIIIPVYNGSNYLREAIDSALSQTYSNCEIIVVNDGSTDDGATRDIALSYGDKIRYFEKENGGVSSALNLAIEQMNGDYFSWLSHDDLYYPNKIERQIEEASKYDDHTIFYSDVDIINENGKVIETVKWDHTMLENKPDYAVLRGSISGISLFIPKKAFDEYGKFDENLRCVQDYLKWFEMLSTYRFVHIDEVLAMSRVHGKQVTRTSPKVLTEGNWLWSYMIEKYPIDKKIQYEGSVYLFHKEMAKFLEKSPYREAQDYALKEMDDIYQKAKKNLSKKDITIFIIDDKGNDELNKTIDSLTTQSFSHYTIIIEGNTKVKGFTNTKNRNDSLKNIHTEYFTFLHAGVVAKKEWLEKQLIQADLSNKSVIISDYPRPIPGDVIDNLCSYLIPFDGIIFRNQNISFTDEMSFLVESGLKGGSYIVNDHYLENVNFNISIKDAYAYLEMVLKKGKSTQYQIAGLCYDISSLYNKYAPYEYKVSMYDDCDELKEIKYSRSYQILRKYIEYRKNRKKDK